MNLGVSIRERKTCSIVVIGGGNINPSADVRIEETSIIDAVWMFIQVHPCFGRAGMNEVAHVFDVFIDRIPRSGTGITFADTNVPGDAAGAASPASLALWVGNEIIRWAEIDILGIAHVLRQFAVTIVSEIEGIRVVGRETPIQPSNHPGGVTLVVSFGESVSPVEGHDDF